MAQGDVEFFDYFLLGLCEKGHDLENDTINIALTDGTTTPIKTLTAPRWQATGGNPDFSAEQIATTGAYTGPVALANPAVTISAGVIQIDWDDPATWSQNGSSPTDATWAIIYNDTHLTKDCIGWVDIGGAFNMTTGDLTITFGTPAATLDQA